MHVGPRSQMSSLGRWIEEIWGPFHSVPDDTEVYGVMVVFMWGLGGVDFACSLFVSSSISDIQVSITEHQLRDGIQAYLMELPYKLPSVILWSGPALIGAAPIIGMVLMLPYRLFIWPFVKAANERQTLRELRLSNVVARPIVALPTAALVALVTSNVVPTSTSAAPKMPVVDVTEELPTSPPIAHMV